VAGINGRPEPTVVGLDLAELAGEGVPWLVLRDGTGRDDVVTARPPAAAGEAYSLTMAPYGGFLATSRVYHGTPGARPPR
jgi:hypothetical protein